ncbi:MAG: tRNA uridine-5-carboxymethylaminomethyl(34) synthesis enzyme MnmG [Synergistaceae bacterium]|nr:tRNA uridine-5-carboxymethylaminomethyl(34) synthesis enzyme MnmG [Synergistaceae bacterium]
MNIADKYDVITIGAGHAGCEAALAASRMGARTLLLCLYLDSIAMMPCNPSIGGPAKGHIVREIDALGGECAAAADASTRHLRWLNTSKGAAVRALRAQCSPRLYSDHYRSALLSEKNLDLHQAEAAELLIEKGEVNGVKIKTGQKFYSECVILATGTYLDSVIHIGLSSHKSGPLGMVAATEFSRSLQRAGLEIGRLRTDTTPRLHFDSIDWDSLDCQRSIEEPQAFSNFGEKRLYGGMVCGLTRTNEETHRIIRKYFPQSPLYTGRLGTEGPRYCPSIDDKIIKFPEKDSHPIFLEPISSEGREVYVQNFSTSMCLEAQFESVRTIKGCEHAHILRPGYAIEYDFIPPTQLFPWLESKAVKNFFLAGQINGTSGYEEAAGQGLIAGINAALRLRGEEPFVLGRDESYIGVLIDDLVTKGTKEPYRMLTSRCEYRLLLRHDNAADRLCAKGRRIGLLSGEKWEKYLKCCERLERERERLSSFKIHPTDEVNEKLARVNSSALSEGICLTELLRRPEVDWETAAELCGSELEPELGRKISDELKYEGYISRQRRQVDKFRRMELLKIPPHIDYSRIKGLSAEGRGKLAEIRPATLGQASRIPGVPPTDIQLLWVAVKSARENRAAE